MRIDFSNISEFKNLPRGNYPFRVTKMELAKASSGNKMFNWELTVSDGEFKGRKLWTRTVLVEDSLWVLRNYLIALGIEVPKGAIDVDPAKVVGKCGVAVVSEGEYNGKPKNYVDDILPATADQGKNEGDKLLEEVTGVKTEQLTISEEPVSSEPVVSEEPEETEEIIETAVISQDIPAPKVVKISEPEKKPEDKKQDDLITFLNK